MAGQADSLKSILFTLFAITAVMGVAVKARMAASGSEREMIRSINRIERAFRDRFPSTSWLFFEPDIED